MLDEQEKLGVGAYTCNCSAGQHGLVSEFQASIGYKVTLCLKQKQKTTEMGKMELMRWNVLKF